VTRQGTARSAGVTPRTGQPPLTRFACWISSQACTIDISKARRELGYRPLKDGTEGLAEFGRPGAPALCGMADTVVVKVKPGSRKGPLVEVGSDGELTIYVREPAVDGKANNAVIRLLAAHLQLPRSRMELVSGATSRLKRFRVSR